MPKTFKHKWRNSCDYWKFKMGHRAWLDLLEELLPYENYDDILHWIDTALEKGVINECEHYFVYRAALKIL